MVVEVLSVVLVLAGVKAARDMIALHRWAPEFFRHGTILFQHEGVVREAPNELPKPEWRAVLFDGAKVRRIGPHEVAFIAPVSNGPLMKGLATFDPETRTVSVTGRLFLGVTPLFGILVLMFLAIDGAPGAFGLVLLSAFEAWSLRGERRRFAEALQSIARAIETGSRGPGRRTMQ